MKRQLKQQLISGLAIALTFGFGSVGNARGASAQSLQNVFGLVTLPLTLFDSRSKQPVNRNISGFSGNLNSNNFNICVLPTCTIPNSLSSPQAIAPNVPRVSSRFARPGMPVAPRRVVPQPTPPRPTLVVPPIKLPINLPF